MAILPLLHVVSTFQRSIKKNKKRIYIYTINKSHTGQIGLNSSLDLIHLFQISFFNITANYEFVFSPKRLCPLSLILSQIHLIDEGST